MKIHHRRQVARRIFSSYNAQLFLFHCPQGDAVKFMLPKAAGSVQQVKVAEIRQLWDPVANQRVPRFHLGPVERFAVIGDKRLNIDFTQKTVIKGRFVPRLWQEMLFDDYAVVIHPCMAEQEDRIASPSSETGRFRIKEKSWLGVYPLLESEWETVLLFHRLTVS